MGFSGSPRFGMLALLLFAVVVPACSASRDAAATIPASRGALASTPQPVQKKQRIFHVVVIVQENRSFDNLFQGYPGANTVSSGKNSKGQTIALQPIPLEVNYNIDHTSPAYFAACDGTGSIPGTDCKMDGFDLEQTFGSGQPKNPQYGYVPQTETKPYFQMANDYVLGDNMFTSQIDASFVSHQYIIGGQANSAVDLPSSSWGCSGGPSDTVVTLTQGRTYGPAESPCFSTPTLASELDAKGLSWHYYAATANDLGYLWLGYQASSYVYNGPDWSNDITLNPQQFISDVKNNKLGAVTWITPTCANSDHSSCRSNTGPSYVASLVNAVGESQYWSTTTIFVMWDEWGGWYDHVPPPYVDYDGLGMRVPLLIISPYAKQGHVSHVQYEQGSILKYIEDTFGLARMAASDKRANSPVPDAIDYRQQARAFIPIQSNVPKDQLMRAALDTRVPDRE